ncbi:hypothetical protein HK102_002344 [Quaeritorhiza haematococci]|nr:hypothetical protein HK102_002344 [Quaeritorhiza haematococci]
MDRAPPDRSMFLLSKAPNLVDFADFSSSKDLNFLDLPVTDGQLPRTPLGVAAAHGHYEIVQCLVDEFDADVRAYCDTALFLATVAENVSIVDYLLDNGAVLRSGNLNPVAWASKMNNPVLLASLLRCGNPGRDIAQPALELAVQAGHVEIVEILFNIAEADSRADDDRLIRLAVQKEHWRLVHFLLDVVYEPFVNTDPAALVVRDEARAAMPVHISEAFMMKEHAALDSNYTEDEKDDYEAPVQISPHPETEIEFLSTNPTTSEMGAIVDEHELLDVEANNNVQHTTSSEEYILEAQEVTVVVGIPTIEVNMVTAEEPVGDGISGLDISPSFTAASAISSTDQSESDFCLV